MIRSSISRVAIAAAAVVLVSTACVPPSPGPVLNGNTQVSAPADTPLARVDISVVDAPPGGWIHITVRHDYLDGSDNVYEDFHFADVASGGTYSTPDFSNTTHRSLLDPGRSLSVEASGDLTYRVTSYPETDPVKLFLYAVGFLPQYATNGCCL